MNTAIEQLAEQAAEAVVAYDHDVMLRVEHEEGATLEVPADFIFKFAELIVRECMEQVWYTREDYINENISEVIKERMKQHFGVKE